MSRQKDLVLDILTGSRGHLTAAQVFERAKEHIPNISLGTVYRNLGELHGDGMIGRFVLSDGSSVYDWSPDPHGHLICPVCGKIEDIGDPCLMDDLRRIAGGSLISAEIVAEHVCSDCLSEVNKA
ncbi:MAG: transcriptional repressor [Oscillospiraceae bacterium]|nr:transcriptional repressor [Oscillospiraceae bacterium]